MSEFIALSAPQQLELTEPFAKAKQAIASHKNIAMIRDLRRRFEDVTYPELLSQLQSWSRPVQPPPMGATPTEKEVVGTNPPYPSGPLAATKGTVSEPRLISVRDISIVFDKAWLADEAELDRYLSNLRVAWLKEIHAGNRVQI